MIANTLSKLVVLCLLLGLDDFARGSLQDVPRNCEDWRVRGVLDRSYYLIDPDQDGPIQPFPVGCDMSTVPAYDIVEHNYNQRTEVVSAPNPAKGLGFNVIYQNVTIHQVKALIDLEASCFQQLKYECHGSLISEKGVMRAYWYSRDNTKMSYWPGGPPSGVGCACGMDRSCAGGAAHFCNCDKNDNVWRSDEGNVTDMDALPITKVFHTDTDGGEEKGFFTLGPLKCQGRVTEQAGKMTFHNSCGSKTKGNQELMMLNADSSAGHCIGWSGLEANTTTSYDLSFSMMADMTSSDGAGNPGVVFNRRDHSNYDLVFFRLHSTKDCYEYGYVEDGKYHNVLTGSCVYISRPSYHKWFKVKVEVRSSRANLYLNEDFVVEMNTHHGSVARGGVLALNGRSFLVLATDYKLSPAQE